MDCFALVYYGVKERASVLPSISTELKSQLSLVEAIPIEYQLARE